MFYIYLSDDVFDLTILLRVWACLCLFPVAAQSRQIDIHMGSKLVRCWFDRSRNVRDEKFEIQRMSLETSDIIFIRKDIACRQYTSIVDWYNKFAMCWYSVIIITQWKCRASCFFSGSWILPIMPKICYSTMLSAASSSHCVIIKLQFHIFQRILP